MFEANLTLKSKDLLVDETGLDEIAVENQAQIPQSYLQQLLTWLPSQISTVFNTSILPTAVADLAFHSIYQQCSTINTFIIVSRSTLARYSHSQITLFTFCFEFNTHAGAKETGRVCNV